MMHIFIFNNASRAANYGIGTYVRLLADGLLGRSGVKVSFVDMFSDVKEYSIAEDERGCRHYKVPALFSGMENEAYCRNVFYFWPGISRRRMMNGWCSISTISSISRLPLC